VLTFSKNVSGKNSPEVVASDLKSNTKRSKAPKPNFRELTAAESAQIRTFSPNLATLQAVIMNDRVIYGTMFCSYDLLCVFTV